MSTNKKQQNIILIGMAGTGKTTVGKKTARFLSWCHVDTDYLLESWWGISLQGLRDWLGLEGFLQAEEDMLCRLNLNRCVISTGGSVIYRQNGMRCLREMGPIIEMFADLKTVRSRLKNVDSRGLAILPGQTVDDLYHERRPLYAAYADKQINTGELDPEQCAREIGKWLNR
jgi:shikimate kinase